MLLLGGLKVILGPGVFTVFDLHKMDIPLLWQELARVTDLGRRQSRYAIAAMPGAECRRQSSLAYVTTKESNMFSSVSIT
eukprot:223751-Pelagomonas_calceolata.AAC.1